MNEFLERISVYRIFNYLLPGILYYYFCSTILWISIEQIWENSLIVTGVVVYFIWMIISRIWSLLIQPAIDYFLKKSSYDDFIEAERKDKKLWELSTEKNIYRTMIALFLCVFITNLIYEIVNYNNICDYNWYVYIFCLLWSTLFLFSYKKQNWFINRRISKAKKDKKQK